MEKKKILLVEDNADLLQGLMIRLKANGYHTYAAQDAVQATSMVRKVEPDLVILDLGLPGGDGFVLMKRWRTMATFTAPIIVLTARDAASARAASMEAGAVAFFQKPVENRDLLAAISLALAEVDPATMAAAF